MIRPGSAEDISGYVVNLQHFSTHDGPGIRTTVFLKGCTLRCKWCCNPETIAPKPELAFNLKLCIGVKECGRCIPVCPEQALHVLDSDGKVRVNWDLCSNCGKCVEVCPSKALYHFGSAMTVTEVLAEVEQDGGFYSESGGGITLSGGECLMQPEFSAALLKEARARGLTTAIETAGNVPWKFMAMVLPYVDTMLHDYKLTDPVAHRRWTGVENTRILENFRRAYDEFPDIDFIARIPLIPGVNDDEAHIDAVLAAVLPYPNVSGLELLPYHRYGDSKYGFLGQVYALEDFTSPAPEQLARLRMRISEQFSKRNPQGLRSQ
ncbi:glycyl-radical enzyme activating protein [Pseudomonas sp. N040]|uniref:glycyl-radical enzyme activating protein n=1 Tax=Pseudomonas sp. N040 TaxID=2785325 RepID=UPI0018A2ACD4|nr:glycyl-radical enzyme activating protein [Pseudomonas sp. N040]MBF7731180.1 glycyl-radical enzyme activating protein [Pseudomonas sp. N040]MBW7014823.1 glycyl-radical enzyme activating protein [Pseudomonas sp. N040]